MRRIVWVALLAAAVAAPVTASRVSAQQLIGDGEIAGTKIMVRELTCDEGVDDLLRHIDEATQFISLDQLAISLKCGFASTAAGNPLTEADEKAKLRLMVDVAEQDRGFVAAA